MKRSFKRVIEGEGVTAEDGALQYLSKAVDGSFRDGVKILDQVISHSRSVILSEIEQAVSGSVGLTVEPIVGALSKKNVGESLKLLNELISNGVDLTYLLVSVMRGLRDKLLKGEVEIEVTKLIFSLDEVARRLATSLDGELLIQVAIVEWCGPAMAGNNQAPNNNNQTKTVSSPEESRDPKSSWQAMKEKMKSGEKISHSDDTIDEAIAIFSK
jgi:DNA polymerase III gamma/tau subunit